MKHKGTYVFTAFFIFFDLVTIVGTWVSAYHFRFSSGFFESPLGVPAQQLYFKLIPFILGIWLLNATFLQTYKKIRYYKSKPRHLLDLIQISIFFTLALIAFSYFYEEYRYSRLTILLFSVMLPISLIISRILSDRLGKFYQLRQPPKPVLLVAAGSCLRNFVSEFKGNISSSIVGVMIPQGEGRDDDLAFCKNHELRVLEERESWSEFFTEISCESVMIALPLSRYRYLEENLDQISDQIPDIKIIPDVLKYTRFKTGIDMIGNTPVIHIHESPLKGLNCLLKRLTDVIGAFLALGIFSPIMLVISVFIPLTSKGPIIYRQRRMGLDGKTFDCLKFRSMPFNAESKTGAVWAKSGDKRATPFGSFLRRTSLDELPQLINVIKGDMSLVGPRPERPIFVNEFRKEVPGYMLRHKVKTGITGWAQVNGWRGSTSIEKRIECDLYYIQNWSFWLDLKILVMTIEEVLIGRNAY